MSVFDAPIEALPLLMACAVYFAAQLMRAFRFWYVYNDKNLSLRKVVAVQLATSVLGWWGPGVVAELVRIGSISFAAGTFIRVLVASLLTRCIDLMLLSALLFVAIGNQGTLSWENPVALSGAIALAGGFFLLFFILVSSNIVQSVKPVLLQRFHSSSSITLARALTHFDVRCRSLIANFRSISFLTAGFTCLIWLADCLAFAFAAPVLASETGLARQIYVLVIFNISKLLSIPSPVPEGELFTQLDAQLRPNLFLPLSILFMVFLVAAVTYSIQRRRHSNRVRHPLSNSSDPSQAFRKGR